MPEARVAEFGAALDDLGVTWGRTTPAAFVDAVDDAVDRPAAGAPLPFESLSLAGTDVTVSPTPAQLRAATTGVTAAGLGIAEYGTVVIQSRPGGDEPVSLYPERHVAVLRRSDLVAGVPEAMEWLGGEFGAGCDSAVLATGPSATADMGELVRGVHGPGTVHVLLVEDR